MYCKAVSSLVFNLVFSLGSSLRIYRINSQNTMRNTLKRYEKYVVLWMKRKRLGDAAPPLKKNRSSISSLCFDPTSIFFPFVRQ